MSKKLFASVGVLALLFGLTACDDEADGTVTSGSEANDGEQNSEDEAAAEEEAEAEEAAEDSDAGSANERPGFGDTYTYDDGLAVTISQPEEFTPDEWAVFGEGFDHHVRMDVTVENGTGEDYDPDLSHISASSAGQEAEAVFDDANDLSGPPATVLLDGQSSTYAVGFSVNDPGDLTVEYSDLDFEVLRDSVVFVSQ